MNRLCWVVAILVTLGMIALGQSKRSAFEGVWQAVEVVHPGPKPTTIKPGPNLSIFSATHYSRVLVEASSRPALANPVSATAEELREVWGPFVAEAGSYELTDTMITFHPIASKNPAAMAPGASIVGSYKVDGKTLKLTIQREYNGPVAYPYTVTFMRIE